jgi:hypothetical protein
MWSRPHLHDNVEQARALAALAVDGVHVLLQDVLVQLPLHAARHSALLSVQNVAVQVPPHAA